MHNHSLDISVVLIVMLALSITFASIYVSRIYLPRKIKKAYVKSITALATAVETRDSGTIGHAQRVAEITVDVAKRLGFSGKDLEKIEYAALLMDIGKASVPQALLNKREPFDPEEWAVVQSHSQLGAEMVSEVPFLADIADYILHHHEYWDGTGYPDALAGEQIPLTSRILSVAADYDAMISERPYHPPMSVSQAVEEIRKFSGIKYDPLVAEVFLEMAEVKVTTSEQAIAA